MKYVIISDSRGIEFPVFCLAPQTHADLAAAWCRDDSRRVVSAGFVEFVQERDPSRSPKYQPAPYAITSGYSHSLNLAPRPIDVQLITAFYRATLQQAAGSAAPAASAVKELGEDCPHCHGTGLHPVSGNPCRHCDYTGRIIA